ncbi:MAG: polyribonucleotide nucleotidyltransferase [Planctomycetes bacterium]|nr:polyribonucleotide nucleotidyltransferase [Planctomycetota bacterium]
MAAVRVERQIGGRTLSIETGRIARQAHGSALVRYADTVIIATAVRAEPRQGITWFPLTVEYREMTYAAGKIPGGFFKREGRPSTKEALTCRMVDRPIRPLFPEGYKDEIQVIVQVLSADQENDPDVLAIIGASAALALSPIPWEGPVGAVRIGLVDGQLVVNPTHAQRDTGQMEMVASGLDGMINMIEVGAREVPEEKVAEALAMAQEVIGTILQMQRELVEKAGSPKAPFAAPKDVAPLEAQIEKGFLAELAAAKQVHGKIERNRTCDEIRTRACEAILVGQGMATDWTEADFNRAWYAVEDRLIRRMLLAGERTDGRRPDDLRPIGCEVGVLPRTHGSALFTRGETQALVVTTLGTGEDQQIIDGLIEEYRKPFMLHYNFPPFSVGEVKMIRGPSRRDIGHGALAEKSLQGVMPTDTEFPYTIRIVSDIMESNGSSSMAAVCGATLSLMDAGVPIKDPVAGISIGRISDGDKELFLTDIQGEEDHVGDMDFKVAGTQKGITGMQLDLKIRGLPLDVCRRALARAREVRLEILKIMLQTIPAPRAEISRHAPRLLQIKINPDKIGKVIGPGGKTIKGLEAATGARIEVEDDGTITISSVDVTAAEKARDAIEALTAEAQIGRIYTGTVVSIKDFGAFIEILPSQDGMCHVSELSDKYVKNVNDVVKMGDTVRVKVISIDDTGRIKLSRKAAMKEDAAAAAGKPADDKKGKE